MASILVKDESAVGKILQEIRISFDEEFISVEELIRQRVCQEVEAFNNDGASKFNGLVRPTELEIELNDYKTKSKRNIDAEKQAYIALDGFQKNRFFIIVDDKQVTSLEEKFLISKDTSVSFVQLTPLVGG